MTDKQNVDLTGNDQIIQKRLADVDPEQSNFAQGIGGDPLYEGIPQLIKTHNEKIIENGHNASIVLGRDRPASRLSGFGGAGHTQAGAIDIVVGRMGYKAKAFLKDGQRVWVDPDFKTDAARIYISQKTNIDENFGLTDGHVGESKTKSAIGLKADDIRIIARQGIKLITKTDDKNSQGGDVESKVGIDLIAGNNDKNLQPMVLGTNMAECIKRVILHLDKLNGIVDSILMTQMTFNEALTHHFHFSPFFGLPTTPSIPVVAAGIKTMADHLLNAKRSLISHKANLALFKFNYTFPVGNKYICSRYHTLN